MTDLPPLHNDAPRRLLQWLGGFRLTDVGEGTVRAQAASIAQIQDCSFCWGGTTGGSVTAESAAGIDGVPLGGSDGVKEHRLTVAEMPEHAHTSSARHLFYNRPRRHRQLPSR